jgi:hypothetical protein
MATSEESLTEPDLAFSREYLEGIVSTEQVIQFVRVTGPVPTPAFHGSSCGVGWLNVYAGGRGGYA